MTAAAARDQRRLSRERRRDLSVASGERSTSQRGGSRNGVTAATHSLRERVRRTPPGAAAAVGAAAGLLTGVVVGKKALNRGNEISGDVAVHLLNKIELLTIRLQVRQARRGKPAEIDVHRVQADASSKS
jgi:hypothetical protein